MKVLLVFKTTQSKSQYELLPRIVVEAISIGRLRMLGERR